MSAWEATRRFARLLRHDVLRGLLARWWVLVLASALACCRCLELDAQAVAASSVGVAFRPVLGDYLCFSLGGVSAGAVDLRLGAEGLSRMPVGWMLAVLLPLALTAEYPIRDLGGLGGSFVLACGSRRVWWASKCVWTVACVAAYWLAYSAPVVIWAAAMGGGPSLGPSPVTLGLLGVAEPLEPGRLSVLPTLATLVPASSALCLLQLLVSLAAPPVAGFAVATVLVFASVFVDTPWLLGGLLMAARSSGLVEGGFDLALALSLAVAASTLSVVSGGAMFCRKDLLGGDRS